MFIKPGSATRTTRTTYSVGTYVGGFSPPDTVRGPLDPGFLRVQIEGTEGSWEVRVEKGWKRKRDFPGLKCGGIERVRQKDWEKGGGGPERAGRTGQKGRSGKRCPLTVHVPSHVYLSHTSTSEPVFVALLSVL